MPELPHRLRFQHKPPEWVGNDAIYFITVCCATRGVSQLDQAAIFGGMVQAIDYYEASGKWCMGLFLAMPDHWHAMLQLPEPEHMEKILKDWKRYVAKRTGIVWQDGFFEHRLRSRQSANEKWQYIRLNPVRKGLVSIPEDWPFVWSPQKSAG